MNIYKSFKMSATGWWASYKLQGFLAIFHRYRSYSSNFSRLQYHQNAVTKREDGMMPVVQQGLQLISWINNGGIWRRADANIVKDDKVIPSPSGPAPPRFNFPLWARWLLGSVLTIFVPFWKQKWAKLQTIEREAEMVVEEVENVAEVVEKVAMVAEKASANAAEKLPDSKLKEAALLVERVSEATAQDAQLTTDFIHKVEALTKDVDDLEAFVEPIVDKIIDECKGK